LFVVAALVVVGFFVRNRLRTDDGRMLLDRLRLKVPVVSGIYLSMAVSRFCRVLGTLLTGGVPIVRSLEISADSTGNRVLSTAVREAAENISAGESLASPLAASGQFPADVVEMIAVGEQSNNLETVLPHIADTLERDTWRRLDLFVRLLEPLMLVLLAGVVLLVVIALLVPVLKMSTTV
jgi:type II secretory pathway component PulF